MKRFFRAALLSFVLVTPSVAQINTERMMAIGQNALYFEDYVLSMQYFNQVIKSRPHLAEPYFYRAVAKIYLDDYSGAEEDCSLALERNNFIVRAYLLRGYARMKTGNFEGAVQDCEKGMEFDPENKALLDYKGLSLLSAKRYKEAEVSLNEYIRRYPNESAGYLARGQMRIECKDTLAAIDEFSRAISVDKSDDTGWGLRGWIYLMKENFQNAVADLNEAIRLNPNKSNSYMCRGMARYRLNDLNGSLQDLDQSIKLNPNSKLAFFNRALIRSYVGDLNHALEDYDKAIELEPNDYLAIYNRAMVRDDVGEYKGAISDLTTIINKYPRYTSAYYQRSDVYKKLGDAKRADRDYFTAWEIEDKAKRARKSGAKTNVSNQADKADDAAADTTQEMFDVNKYNRMMISSTLEEDNKKYENPMRGRIQNNNTEFELEAMFNLSYYETLRLGPVQRVMDFGKYQATLSETGVKGGSQLLVTNREEALSGKQIDAHFASINDLSEKIGKRPDHATLFFLRGLDFVLLQDYTSAMEDLNRSLTLDDTNVLAYFERASLRYRKMLVEYADKKYQDVLKNAPMSVNTKTKARKETYRDEENELGEKAFGTDYALILKDLEKVLQLDPQFVYAYYNMGNIRCLQRDFRNALIDYSNAIELSPEFADAYFNRGLTYIYLGDRKKGLEDLRKAGQLGAYKAYNIIKRLEEVANAR